MHRGPLLWHAVLEYAFCANSSHMGCLNEMSIYCLTAYILPAAPVPTHLLQLDVHRLGKALQQVPLAFSIHDRSNRTPRQNTIHDLIDAEVAAANPPRKYALPCKIRSRRTRTAQATGSLPSSNVDFPYVNGQAICIPYERSRGCAAGLRCRGFSPPACWRRRNRCPYLPQPGLSPVPPPHQL